MTTLYKLTNRDDRTRNDTQWGAGVTHTAPGGGPLCTSSWLHAYRDPLLAVLMDPVHNEFGPSAHLWEAEGEVGIDDGTKVGCTSLTTLRRIDLPQVTMAQCVRFAILAVEAGYADLTRQDWADDWLSGKDRSAAAANSASSAVLNANYAAAYAAAADAAYAAAVSDATNDATEHDTAAKATAYYAATAANSAAFLVAKGNAVLDLVTIAHQAVEEEPA